MRTHRTLASLATAITLASSSTFTKLFNRCCQGAGCALLAIAVLTGLPRSALACAWYNPLCFLEDEFKLVWGAAVDALKLEWDIYTLNPKDAWNDFQDAASETVCAGYPLQTLIVAYGIQEHFDNCESGPEPIGDDILAKLSLYFRSSLASVQIHNNCQLGTSSRYAITFGEHIYFNQDRYNPHTDEGFALLSHELTHVMQYRQEGFHKFVCEYAAKCSLGRITHAMLRITHTECKTWCSKTGGEIKMASLRVP
jgi:hypothetical protein